MAREQLFDRLSTLGQEGIDGGLDVLGAYLAEAR